MQIVAYSRYLCTNDRFARDNFFNCFIHALTKKTPSIEPVADVLLVTDKSTNDVFRPASELTERLEHTTEFQYVAATLDRHLLAS